MKRNSFLISALIIVFVTLFASSCGQVAFDHGEYVKALLDHTYKGEHDAYAEKADIIPEEAMLQYEHNINYLANDFLETLSVKMSEENYKKLYGYFENILKFAQYEIVSSEESEEGGKCTVYITISPVTNFTGLNPKIKEIVEAFANKTNSFDFDGLDIESTNEELANEILSAVDESSKTPSYGETIDFVVDVLYDSEKKFWFVSDDSQKAIFDAIFPR